MLRILLTLALSGALLFSQKKPVTLESLGRTRPLMFGGGSTWAPDGKRFAYMEGKSLWVYDVPSKSKKEVANTAALESAAVKPPEAGQFDWQNRRVSEERFQWSASGKQILFSVNGDLFLWNLDTGKWDQLTATPAAERDARLSPDGKQVAFRRGHDLYAMEMASKKTTRLTTDGSDTLLNGELDWVYPEELELGRAWWWSPDSSRIAYMQFDVSRQAVYPHADLLAPSPVFEPERYPYAGTPNADVRLGVIPAAGGRTRWMDLGETRDTLMARVNWLPGNHGIAVQKFNRVQDRLDLLLANPGDGTSRLIFRETSPHWINVSDDFRPLGDGSRFLWSSERDGFRHLYLFRLDGKQVAQLTKGDYETDGIAGVDEKNGRVYYLSSEPSPLERHLYSVGFDGEDKKRLTAMAGTHAISMSPTCDYYLDAASNFTTPSSRVLYTSDGNPWAVYREADRKTADEYELLPAEILTVKAADGAMLYARLIRPAGFDPSKKYPAIVMIYGGPHTQTIRNSWSGATWEQALAQRGFVIWQLDNRGSSGRGAKWEATLYRRLGARELEDQKTGIAQLVSMGFVDPARIGIYGWSYGGYMTLYSLLNAPDLFRAGVAGAPVTNWRNYDTIYTERYLGLPSENEEGYRASSALTYAANLKAKLLLVHNIDDDNVLFRNTMQMADALQKAKKPFEMMVYPQKAHGVIGPVRQQMLEMMTAFFERELKGR